MVAVTGAASGPGRVLAARLAHRLTRPAPPGTTAEIRKVIALDDHRGNVPGVTWRVVDIRDPLLSHRISDVDTIVHLDVDHSPDSDHRARRAHNVSGAQSVLTAAAAARVGHVVIVTSGIVHAGGPGSAARPGDVVPLPEDTPLPAGLGTGTARPGDAADPGVAEDFAEIERLAAGVAAGHPQLTCTVARPAAVVGPGVDTMVTRYFAAPRLLGLRGTTPRWQFCHVDDLAAGLEQVVLGRIPGVVGIGCDGWLEPEDVAEITGRCRLDLPAPVVFGLAYRLHRMGLAQAPALELRYVARPWVVDCATLRATGWKPAYDNASALRALVTEVTERQAAKTRWRPPGRRATMVAAAGTAGAIILTATVLGVRRGPWCRGVRGRRPVRRP